MHSGRSEPNESNPHWSDRLITRIDTTTVTRWIFYPALFVSLGLLLNVSSWVLGDGEAGIFDTFFFLPGFWLTVYLLTNHMLVVAGRNALIRYSELIPNSEQELDLHLFQISHVPRTAGHIWFVGGGVLGAATLLYAGNNIELAREYPLAYLLIFSILGSAFFMLAIFRIIHQMGIVVSIFDSIDSVNLYDLSSVYSLALFPVRIVLILLFTFWVNPVFILFPDWLKDPVIQSLWIVLSLVASLIVIAPLRGIRSRLKREKETLIKENGRLLRSVREDLSRSINSGDHDQIAHLEKEISALFAFRSSLEKIPTMPWKPETVRWLVTALLLPLSLWVIQFFLQRYLGG